MKILNPQQVQEREKDKVTEASPSDDIAADAAAKNPLLASDVEKPKAKRKNLPSYSRDEVRKHNKVDDIWIVIDNKVYDVTSWMGKHPGGSRIIEVQAGEDVTVPFLVNHTEKIQMRKNAFLIGYIKDGDREHLSPLATDIFAWKKDLIERGYYKSDALFYVRRIALIIALFICGWRLVTMNLACQILASVCIALYLQQMAFLGHDIGHNSFTGDSWTDYLIGSALYCGLGLSVSWWKINHHTHHAVTNSVEHDPDIQHLPFLSVSTEQLKNAYWSKYYKKWFAMDKIAQYLISKQHYLCFIIFAFSRFNLHFHSIHALLTEKHIPLHNRMLELLGTAGYIAWYSAWCMSAGSWQRSLMVFALSTAIAGNILSIQIGISHWISPVVHNHPMNTEGDWFRHQLRTTVDVDCHPLNDWFHGGLQFQTIHHLLPRIPRCHLRELREELKVILKNHGIEYPSLSFFDILVEMMRTFAKVAHEAAGYKTVDYPESLADPSTSLPTPTKEK